MERQKPWSPWVAWQSAMEKSWQKRFQRLMQFWGLMITKISPRSCNQFSPEILTNHIPHKIDERSFLSHRWQEQRRVVKFVMLNINQVWERGDRSLENGWVTRLGLRSRLLRVVTGVVRSALSRISVAHLFHAHRRRFWKKRSGSPTVA